MNTGMLIFLLDTNKRHVHTLSTSKHIKATRYVYRVAENADWRT